jgi:hypothetical protein
LGGGGEGVARGEKARHRGGERTAMGGGGEGVAWGEKAQFQKRGRWCAARRSWGGAHRAMVPWWPGGRAWLGQVGAAAGFGSYGFFF